MNKLLDKIKKLFYVFVEEEPVKETPKVILKENKVVFIEPYDLEADFKEKMQEKSKEDNFPQ